MLIVKIVLVIISCLSFSHSQFVPNANDQCRVLVGESGSLCHANTSNICIELVCRRKTSAAATISEQACMAIRQPAANGTICDSNKVCYLGKCVLNDDLISQTLNISKSLLNPDCPFGDDVLTADGAGKEQQVAIKKLFNELNIQETQLDCESFMARLATANQTTTKITNRTPTPFEYCSRPFIRRACCHTCKLYDAFTCQDLYPSECPSSNHLCSNPSAQINGVNIRIACARTCQICKQDKFTCPSNNNSSYVCLNSGTCVNTTTNSNPYIGFTCNCTDGYYGKFCELKNPCEPNPCENGGLCIQLGATDFKCQCKPGFSGKVCLPMAVARSGGWGCPKCYPNVCFPNPCNPAGTCYPYGPGGFYCQCRQGFYGDRCQYSNACFYRPCLNGGNCFPNNNWPLYYTCVCPPGFYGKNCEYCYPPPPPPPPPPVCRDVDRAFCLVVLQNNYCNTAIGNNCPYTCNKCCVDGSRTASSGATIAHH